MKVLLTSAGFENKKISDAFLSMIHKDPKDITVVFIPTAANTADAIAMLPKCMNDLLNIGINKGNIHVYDLHYKMKYQLLKQYDAVYVCGGSTDYLIERVNKTGFKGALLRYIRQDGVYVGVSAGSCIAATNVKGGLGLIHALLNVHCEAGEMPGPLHPDRDHINLTNRQSIVIRDQEILILE